MLTRCLSGVRFTSATTNDSFMLKPVNFHDGDVLAMDRVYIDYAKPEELTNRGVIYVTKMKKKFHICIMGIYHVAEFYGTNHVTKFLLGKNCPWNIYFVVSQSLNNVIILIAVRVIYDNMTIMCCVSNACI